MMNVHTRVYKMKGSDSWRNDIRYKDPVTGKPQRERTVVGRTKVEAEMAARNRANDIEAMLLASKKGGGGLLRTPFREYAIDWLARKKTEIEVATWYQYRSGITRFAIPILGNKPICEIGRADIFAVKDEISKGMVPGAKGRSKNHMMSGLKCLFADAFDREHIKTNPAAGLKKLKFKVEPTEINPLATSEINTFLDDVDPFFRDYFTLAFRRGLRESETIPLRWSHIDFNTGTIQIRIGFKETTNTEGKLKTAGSNRDIPMDDELCAMLRRRKSDSNGEDSYVFPGKDGGRITPDDLRAAWRDGLYKASLKHRDMRQTRHTFASVAISAGEDVYWVMKVMGHTTLQMIHQHYGRWINSRTRKDGLALQNALRRKPHDDNKAVSDSGAAPDVSAVKPGAEPTLQYAI